MRWDLLGPGAGDKGWEAPILKFQARERQWAGKHLGIFYNLRAYRIFAFSILQFYLQFYGDKDEALQAEAKAMNTHLPGPGHVVHATGSLVAAQPTGSSHRGPQPPEHQHRLQDAALPLGTSAS